MKGGLLGPDVLRTLNGYDSIDVLRYHYDRANTDDPLSRIQYVDIKTYLTDDICVKVDRASIAQFAWKCRSPLLDHKLMELAAQMPSDIKLNNGQGKYIFKRALRTVLPGKYSHNRQNKGLHLQLQTASGESSVTEPIAPSSTPGMN